MLLPLRLNHAQLGTCGVCGPEGPRPLQYPELREGVAGGHAGFEGGADGLFRTGLFKRAAEDLDGGFRGASDAGMVLIGAANVSFQLAPGDSSGGKATALAGRTLAVVRDLGGSIRAQAYPPLRIRL
jgi:hypothetical protein